MLCGKLTKMAISGLYSSGEYTTSINMVRDAIIDLAQQGEFGLVKELADHSTRILDQSNLPNGDSEHYVKHEDFLYHIQVLPSAPSGLINHIGIDQKTNTLIVESATKSRGLNTIEGSTYAYRMMVRLAEDDDITNWNKVAAILLKHPFNTDTVLRAFSHFKKELVAAHNAEFSGLKNALVGFKPGSFLLDSGTQKINEIKLLDNLYTLGEKELVHQIVSVSFEYRSPFKIHQCVHDYGFEPSTEYLQSLEKCCVPAPDKRYATLCVSLYAYLLSQGDHELNMNRLLTPDQLMDVFSSEGAETPMGLLTYDKRKVGLLLDTVLKETGRQRKGSTAPLVDYEKKIPKNLLMLSNYYKGIQVSDALGL